MVFTTGDNNFGVAKWIVNATAGLGTHTTIAAALTSASSGDTVFIMPGTYTENLTLKAGVNITGFDGDGVVSGIGANIAANVIILGTASVTYTGSVTASGIQFKTNSAAAIASSGSNAADLILNACSVYANNSTGITLNNASANLICYNCSFNSSSTNLLFAITTGPVDFEYCTFSLSATSSASTVAVTNVLFNACDMEGVNVTTSTTGSVTAIGCNWAYGGNTLLTTAGTGNSAIYSSSLASTTASAISVGAGTSVTLCNSAVASSNTNAITGAGTLKYGGVVFNSTSSTINTTTQTGLPLSVIQGGTGAVTLTGVLIGNTTGAVTASAITQYDVLVGGASNAISSVGPGSAGQVLQSAGNAANPVYSTATYPATATGTGTILRADGTNWVATTATYPATTTINQLLYSSSTSVVAGLATANNGVVITGTTGIPSVLANGTTGQLLTATTGAAPSWVSITNAYSEGVFTPTLIGTVAGSTTYTAQTGYYTRIGNTVFLTAYIALTAATGTGTLILGALPFTIRNQLTYYPQGSIFWDGGASWVFPTAATSLTVIGFLNSTTANVWVAGTAIAGNYMQMANATLVVSYSLSYQI